MKTTSIKKGKILTSIECSNGFWTNNLYCNDIEIIEDTDLETLTLSLHFLKQSFNGSDFEDFIENINWLKTISIRDDYTIQGIVSFLRYGRRSTFKKKIELIAGVNRPIFDISFKKSEYNLTIVRL